LEEDGKVQNKRNCYVLEMDPRGLQIWLQYHDRAFASDLGQAKTSYLMVHLHCCLQTRKDVD
jgi:hypothetical protein